MTDQTKDVVDALSLSVNLRFTKSSRINLSECTNMLEFLCITTALKYSQGSVRAAAARLGMPRTTLAQKMHKLKIEREEFIQCAES